MLKFYFLVLILFYFTFSGDPTVFGNLRPCGEITQAVIDSVQSMDHNGYAPSTGKFYVDEHSGPNMITHIKLSVVKMTSY